MYIVPLYCEFVSYVYAVPLYGTLYLYNDLIWEILCSRALTLRIRVYLYSALIWDLVSIQCDLIWEILCSRALTLLLYLSLCWTLY